MPTGPTAVHNAGMIAAADRVFSGPDAVERARSATLASRVPHAAITDGRFTIERHLLPFTRGLPLDPSRRPILGALWAAALSTGDPSPDLPSLDWLVSDRMSTLVPADLADRLAELIVHAWDFDDRLDELTALGHRLLHMAPSAPSVASVPEIAAALDDRDPTPADLVRRTVVELPDRWRK